MGDMSARAATVTFLGTRGSMPVSGPQFQVFGGATSCVMVQMGEAHILLDAGSGLTAAAEHFAALPGGRATILLSHTHLDHIIGLLSFGAPARPQWQFDICGPALSGLEVGRQLERLMAPPLWPISPGDAFGPQTRFVTLVPGVFHIGDVTVTADTGNHPGGAMLYRLDWGGKSLVYATDFEHSDDATPRLEALARGCDLLIYDAQFSDAEYDAFARGWGHSTWEKGAALASAWGVRRTRLFHHSGKLDDRALAARERMAQALCPNVAFARALEEIRL